MIDEPSDNLIMSKVFYKESIPKGVTHNQLNQFVNEKFKLCIPRLRYGNQLITKNLKLHIFISKFKFIVVFI